MFHPVICSAVVLSLALLSGLSYRHSGRGYVKGKTRPIKSLPAFPLVYRYVQMTSVGIPIACYFTFWRPLLQIHHRVWVAYTGIAIAVAAMTLFLWAKRSLGDQYSPCSDSFVPLQLVKSGPYRWMRHPIYAANLLLITGMFVSSGSLWIALNLFILATYYAYSASSEENSLAVHLDGYEAYRRSSGAFFPRWKPLE